MRALCWHGKGDIRCDTVPDPSIEDPRDVIIKVSSCAIRGSDLPLMGGQMPGMERGAGPIPVNMAAVVQKGLTMKTGQTHVKRYMEPLTRLIQQGVIDAASVISHRSSDLTDGPALYEAFRDKTDGCTKVVFHLG